MENSARDTPLANRMLTCGMVTHAARLGVFTMLVLTLSACERQGVPPSPADPVKPKMQVGRNMGEVQKAIYHYIRPVRKASSSMQPDPAEGPGGRLQV
ncbi:hypothetical protein [Janthinobacterium sp. 17J80-10]|uniref:hypothetical protein n=1 Tax=Janthinobacterium sp. 17J80-10 TaxID=2497863 RepID=UPI001005A228|nr:hypothetical protein [Janthinobacterium sp. 17J80-10]QAU34041.1 hypothetical protein EKL02_07465 [Janthinobacterium sp. 17J80-10]